MSATKWIETKKESNGKESLVVHQQAGNDILKPLGENVVNLISIFGAARQGKSFFMNLLSGKEDLFKISNKRDPCTQGIDLASYVLPLEKFSRLNSGTPVSSKHKIQIGFADAEGQGDRDVTYDSRLISPVLLASKAVIFNWKDTLQADRILNLLAILARAAQGIEPGDGNSKVFGHLHIVFRDWNFADGESSSVYDDLFKKEVGRSNEVSIRNQARHALLEAFEKITVWLFPPPVADTAGLAQKIRFDHLQDSFKKKLQDFRREISRQLAEPMRFNGQILTGSRISQLVPALIDVLNNDEVIMPQPIFATMMRSEAMAISALLRNSIVEICQSSADPTDMLSTQLLTATVKPRIQGVLEKAKQVLGSFSEEIQIEIGNSLAEYAGREFNNLIREHNIRLATFTTQMGEKIRENMDSDYLQLEASLPMNKEALQTKAESILDEALFSLKELPSSDDPQIVSAEIHRLTCHSKNKTERLVLLNEKEWVKQKEERAKQLEYARKVMKDMMQKSFEDLKTPYTLTELYDSFDLVFRSALKSLAGNFSDPSMYEGDLNAYADHLRQGDFREKYFDLVKVASSRCFDQVTHQFDLDMKEKIGAFLPLSDEQIESRITECVEKAKLAMANQMDGWTMRREDAIEYAERLTSIGNVHRMHFLEKSKELQSTRTKKEREEMLKREIDQCLVELENEIQPLLPTRKEVIEKKFESFMETKALAISSDLGIDVAFTKEKLRNGSQLMLRHLLILNISAEERSQVTALKERENQWNEEKQITEKEMEAVLQRAQSAAQAKDIETTRLQSALWEESERTRKLEQELEMMKAALAQTSSQSTAWEERAKKEAEKRSIAEEAALRAAAAADLSARAAQEAAAAAEAAPEDGGAPEEDAASTTPTTTPSSQVGRGRKRGINDVGSTPKQSNSDVKTPVSRRISRRSSLKPTPGNHSDVENECTPKAIRSGKKLNAIKSPSSQLTPGKQLIEEAKTKAREDLQKRIEERASHLLSKQK